MAIITAVIAIIIAYFVLRPKKYNKTRGHR